MTLKQLDAMTRVLWCCDDIFAWLESDMGRLVTQYGEPVRDYKYCGRRIRELIAEALAIDGAMEGA